MLRQIDVQLFLETHTFGELQSQWGVYARVSKDGKKFSLNYDQLEYTPGHRGAEQCRGAVLALELAHGNASIPHVDGKPDTSFCPGKTVVFAYPFDKFYNSHEQYAAQIDWADSKLRVEDKMDGTLCILYWDATQKEWHVATRSVPEADLPIDGNVNLTFRLLFERAVQEQFGVSFARWVARLPKSYTWCFELTSPYNRVFVDYKRSAVTLLGIRDNFTLLERDPDEVIKELNLDVPRPNRWSFKTLDEIALFVNNMPPEKCEGAVVIDGTFRRVKIKNSQWVVANATKSTLSSSPRNLVRYILQGTSDDITAMMPTETQNDITRFKTKINQFFSEIDKTFAEIYSKTSDRKTFAMLVSAQRLWKAPFFKLYEGKISSSREFVDNMIKANLLGEPTIDIMLGYINDNDV